MDIPVSRGTAVVEERVGVVDSLGESETFVLLARGKSGPVSGLVARAEFARLRDSVVAPSPDPVEGVTGGRVDGERNHAEDTLGGCDVDGVGRTGACLLGGASSIGGRRSHGSHRSVRSNAFCTNAKSI